MSYRVKLNVFEGPFDLLVYLIEHAEMSIYDIQISEIVKQYMEHVKAMQITDVNVSSEFMVLAAALLEIKSKMLLPRAVPEEGSAEVAEDPRTQLVAKLLEYKKFKRISEMLEACEEHTAKILEKPQEDLAAYTGEPDEYLSLDLKQFAAAFASFIEKKQRIEAVRKQYTRIQRERATTENRISYIASKIRQKIGKIFDFRELIPDKKDRYDVVVSFISVLEMAKERVVNVRQKVTYGNIEIESGERINEGDIRYEQ